MLCKHCCPSPPPNPSQAWCLTLASSFKGRLTEAKRKCIHIIAQIFNQPGHLESNTTIWDTADCQQFFADGDNSQENTRECHCGESGLFPLTRIPPAENTPVVIGKATEENIDADHKAQESTEQRVFEPEVSRILSNSPTLLPLSLLHSAKQNWAKNKGIKTSLISPQ